MPGTHELYTVFERKARGSVPAMGGDRIKQKDGAASCGCECVSYSVV